MSNITDALVFARKKGLRAFQRKGGIVSATNGTYITVSMVKRGDNSVRLDFLMVDTKTGRTWPLVREFKIVAAFSHILVENYSDLPEVDALAKFYLGYDRVYLVDGKYVFAEEYRKMDEVAKARAEYHEKFGGVVQLAEHVNKRLSSSFVVPDPATAYSYGVHGFRLFTDRSVSGLVSGLDRNGHTIYRRRTVLSYNEQTQLRNGDDALSSTDLLILGFRKRWLSSWHVSQSTPTELSTKAKQAYRSGLPANHNEREDDMTDLTTATALIPDPSLGVRIVVSRVHHSRCGLIGHCTAYDKDGKVLFERTVNLTSADIAEWTLDGLRGDRAICKKHFLSQWMAEWAEQNTKAELLEIRDIARMFPLKALTHRSKNQVRLVFGLPDGHADCDVLVDLDKHGFTVHDTESIIAAGRKSVSASYQMRDAMAAFGRDYPLPVANGVIQLTDTLFLWYDRDKQPGGITHDLDDAVSRAGGITDDQAAALNADTPEVDLGKASVSEDRFAEYRGKDLDYLCDAFSVMDTDTMNDGWGDQPDANQSDLARGYFTATGAPGDVQYKFPHPPGMHAVVDNSGVISYHVHETDAFTFRMALINICLNGMG